MLRVVSRLIPGPISRRGAADEMNPLKRMQGKRNDWRSKATKRATVSREMRKKLKRADEKLKRADAELAAMRAELHNARQAAEAASRAVIAAGDDEAAKPPGAAPLDQDQTRVTCVFISINAIISFRAVPRALMASILMLGVPLCWIPSFTSVINWTLRVGLALLNGVGILPDEPWVAVMDISIDVGIKKVLVVLRVPWSALAARGTALALADAKCIGIKVSENWKGRTVADALKGIFATSGMPTAILKDQGGDIGLGVRLWQCENNGESVAVIGDIGHACANALKAVFGKLEYFKQLLAIVRKGAAKIRQSDIAFLMPPKLRTKGRFMAISRTAEWAEKILELLTGTPTAGNAALIEKLRRFLPGFENFRALITNFAQSSLLVRDVLELLKNKGLSAETYRIAKKRLEELPSHCRVRTRLIEWLDQHMVILLKLGCEVLPVSSDLLESLFGKFKGIVARNPKAEFNRNVLAIPCLCGNLSASTIDEALSAVSHSDLEQWEREHVIETLHRKRREAFRGLPSRRIGPVPRKVA